VLLGAKRGRHERLSLTTGEQCAAVCTRQHAQANADGTHSTGITAVDTRLAAQDLTAHDLCLEVEQDVLDFDGVGYIFALGSGMLRQLGLDLRVDVAQRVGALLLAADLVGSLQAFETGGLYSSDQRVV